MVNVFMDETMPTSTIIGTSTSVWSPVGIYSSTPTPSFRRQAIVQQIVDQGYWIKATGSRVTKDGWTNESDWDYVVFDPDKKFWNSLDESNWTIGSDADQGEFISIRQGDTNLILVDKEEVWKKYIIATNLIKTLNSKTKGERIAVFDSVFGKDKNAAAVEF